MPLRNQLGEVPNLREDRKWWGVRLQTTWWWARRCHNSWLRTLACHRAGWDGWLCASKYPRLFGPHRPNQWQYFNILRNLIALDERSVLVADTTVYFVYDSLNKPMRAGLLNRLMTVHYVAHHFSQEGVQTTHSFLQFEMEIVLLSIIVLTNWLRGHVVHVTLSIKILLRYWFRHGLGLRANPPSQTCTSCSRTSCSRWKWGCDRLLLSDRGTPGCQEHRWIVQEVMWIWKGDGVRKLKFRLRSEARGDTGNSCWDTWRLAYPFVEKASERHHVSPWKQRQSRSWECRRQAHYGPQSQRISHQTCSDTVVRHSLCEDWV